MNNSTQQQLSGYLIKIISKISTIIFLFFGAFTLCTLCGCIPNKYVAKQQYLLHVDPTIQSPTTPITASKRPLLVAPVSIEAPFDQQNFIYRVSDNQYLVDYYNSFLVAPARQLDSLLLRYLQATKKFSVAELTGTTSMSNNNVAGRVSSVILKIKVLELYADYRDRNHPQAVAVLQVSSGPAPLALISKTLQATIPLKAKNTESLLTAWEQCFEVLFNKIDQLIITTRNYSGYTLKQ